MNELPYSTECKALMREALSGVTRIALDVDRNLYPVTESIDAIIRTKIIETTSGLIGVEFDLTKHAFDCIFDNPDTGAGSAKATLEMIFGGQFPFTDGFSMMSSLSEITDNADKTDIGPLVREMVAGLINEGSFSSNELNKRLAKLVVAHSLASTVEQTVEHIEPNPDLVEMITSLKSTGAEGRAIDIITSSTRERAIAILQKIGFEDPEQYFGVILTEEDGDKKRGDVYARYLEITGLENPAQALMIGDSYKADVAGPQKHGLMAIQHDPERKREQTDEPNCIILNSLFQLPELMAA